MRERERNRVKETETETDRQTDGQTDRQKDKDCNSVVVKVIPFPCSFLKSFRCFPVSDREICNLGTL